MTRPRVAIALWLAAFGCACTSQGVLGSAAPLEQSAGSDGSLDDAEGEGVDDDGDGLVDQEGDDGEESDDDESLEPPHEDDDGPGEAPSDDEGVEVEAGASGSDGMDDDAAGDASIPDEPAEQEGEEEGEPSDS